MIKFTGKCIVIEIRICEGATPIQVIKIASDYVDVSMIYDDSCGAPYTKTRMH